MIEKTNVPIRNSVMAPMLGSATNCALIAIRNWRLINNNSTRDQQPTTLCQQRGFKTCYSNRVICILTIAVFLTSIFSISVEDNGYLLQPIMGFSLNTFLWIYWPWAIASRQCLVKCLVRKLTVFAVFLSKQNPTFSFYNRANF